MKKDKVIAQLVAAKEAHISWVNKARALIEGIEIDKSVIPVKETDCKFGSWFYSDAQKLINLRNNPKENMDLIESLHRNLHNEYAKIYQIYYVKDSRGFFAKFFKRKRKISEYDVVEAKEYFERLSAISIALLDEINRMQRRISAISPSEIEAICK